MTDIMKLATDYAQACYNLANPDSYDAECAEEARAALQSAIEALQAECAEHKENAMRNARIAVSIRAERDQLQAEIERLAHANNALKLAVSGLQSQLDAMQESLREHRERSHQAEQAYLAEAPKALAPLTPDERQQVVELLDKEGHDGKDFEPECPLCTARQKLAAIGIGGTP